ncbi:MAG: hypothetical protein ACFE0O_04510 [Opitutales bacterium]
MMTVHSAPTWFALNILLQGVQHRNQAALKPSYWSSILTLGESLICRLEKEQFKAYSELKDPPTIHPDVKEFITQLHTLRESQLTGKALDSFKKKAKAANQVVAEQLGSSISWP